MDGCIFCKIAAGEIPSATLYEDENFRVILDLGPANRGHSLVIPKGHYKNMFEMPEDLLKEAYVIARKVAGALMKGLEVEGIQLMQNNGAAAGQTVDHFHIHLIPASKEGKPGAGWYPKELSDADKEAIPVLVKKYL